MPHGPLNDRSFVLAAALCTRPLINTAFLLALSNSSRNEEEEGEGKVRFVYTRAYARNGTRVEANRRLFMVREYVHRKSEHDAGAR